MSWVAGQVRQAIEDARKPRIHGNGFIQLDLNDAGTCRLHVWDESLPRQTVATPIHDHVFALRSHVLLGTLIHTEYEPVEDDEGTHVVYRAQRAEGTQNTTLVPDDQLVRIAMQQNLMLAAGSTYVFPAWRLHRSDHVGLTATLMYKVNAPGEYGNPRVLCNVGSEPDNSFDRDGHDAGMMWHHIFRAVGLS